MLQHWPPHYYAMLIIDIDDALLHDFAITYRLTSLHATDRYSLHFQQPTFSSSSQLYFYLISASSLYRLVIYHFTCWDKWPTISFFDFERTTTEYYFMQLLPQSFRKNGL